MDSKEVSKCRCKEKDTLSLCLRDRVLVCRISRKNGDGEIVNIPEQNGMIIQCFLDSTTNLVMYVVEFDENKDRWFIYPSDICKIYEDVCECKKKDWSKVKSKKAKSPSFDIETGRVSLGMEDITFRREATIEPSAPITLRRREVIQEED